MHLPIALIVEAAIGIYLLLRRDTQIANATAAQVRATKEYRPRYGRHS
jgi:hypothetical protein